MKFCLETQNIHPHYHVHCVLQFCYLPFMEFSSLSHPLSVLWTSAVRGYTSMYHFGIVKNYLAGKSPWDTCVTTWQPLIFSPHSANWYARAPRYLNIHPKKIPHQGRGSLLCSVEQCMLFRRETSN